MTHDRYVELDDEIPLLSLIGGVAMALVIAVFKPGRRVRRNKEIARLVSKLRASE